MNSDKWESHLRKICAANKKRHDVLLQTITETMGDSVIVLGENAGLHVLLESTKGLSEQDMIDRAKEKGVLVHPVSPFWMNLNSYSNNMVLLGFGNLSEADIINGVQKINEAWNQ